MDRMPTFKVMNSMTPKGVETPREILCAVQASCDLCLHPILKTGTIQARLDITDCTALTISLDISSTVRNCPSFRQGIRVHFGPVASSR